MCGRYVAATPPDRLADLFGIDDVRTEDLGPRWNVAPTLDVYAVANSRDGTRSLGSFRWGLVPWFAKDPAGGAKMINARAETLTEKPAFKRLLERRRCILPADGFYEWLRTGKERLPQLFTAADGSVLGFAGLWDVWRPKDDSGGEPLRTCTIITTSANGMMRPIHDRMPVVLPPEVWDRWLDPALEQPSEALELLVPPPDDFLVRRAVSTKVNNVKNEGEELLNSA